MDIGSDVTRVGYANETQPRTTFPSLTCEGFVKPYL